MNPASITVVNREDGRCTIALSGCWSLYGTVPDYHSEFARLGQPSQIVLTADGLQQWDSTVLAAITYLYRFSEKSGCSVDSSALPPGLVRLVNLATAVAPKATSSAPRRPYFLNGLVGMLTNTTVESTRSLSLSEKYVLL
jgi:hypothetical protein